MTLEEMKQKIYSMIEEYNEDADELTEDEDLAALVTCTPIGINTHRLIVKGKRV